MIIDNIHKKRGIRALLCKIGRHDYEPMDAGRDLTGRWVLLECFYCYRKKKSWYKREPFQA